MSVRGPLRKKTLAGILSRKKFTGMYQDRSGERGLGGETQEISVATLLEVALFAMLLLNCETVGIVQVQFLLLWRLILLEVYKLWFTGLEVSQRCRVLDLPSDLLTSTQVTEAAISQGLRDLTGRREAIVARRRAEEYRVLATASVPTADDGPGGAVHLDLASQVRHDEKAAVNASGKGAGVEFLCSAQ